MNLWFLYLYYVILFSTFLLSLTFAKKSKANKVLAILLFFSVLTEGGAYIIREKKQNYYFLYHFFTPLEYSLIVLYFYHSDISQGYKRLILATIPIFVSCSLILSFCFIKLPEYPGLQYNIEGILVILISIGCLFGIKPAADRSIFYELTFWIGAALIIFFSGIFFINGIFNFFFTANDKEVERIHALINCFFNYILYILMAIGMLCSNQKMRS